jgi:NAD(P)-dependent dehydrogenase (short-subunit alcohol dehydrogenase family)
MNADLRDIEALRAACAEAAQAHGPVTVLINNAAFDQRHAVGTTTRRSICARISSPRRRSRRA